MSEKLLFETVARVLKVPLETIALDSSPETIARWDSMAQVALMLEVEAAFSVRLPSDSLMELTSVRKIRDALVELGALVPADT